MNAMVATLQLQRCKYRLIVDLGGGCMQSNPVEFRSAGAALKAAPHLNLSRALAGRQVYTHVARFADGKCMAVVPLERAA